MNDRPIEISLTVYDHEHGAELNARAAIEQMIYVLADNNLATTKVISEALEWWSKEVYGVLGDDPEQKEMH